MAKKGGRYAGNMPGGAQPIPGYPAPPNNGAAYQAKLDATHEIKAILSEFTRARRERLEAAVAEMRRQMPDPRDLLAELRKARDYLAGKA